MRLLKDLGEVAAMTGDGVNGEATGEVAASLVIPPPTVFTLIRSSCVVPPISLR